VPLTTIRKANLRLARSTNQSGTKTEDGLKRHWPRLLGRLSLVASLGSQIEHKIHAGFASFNSPRMLYLKALGPSTSPYDQPSMRYSRGIENRESNTCNLADSKSVEIYRMCGPRVPGSPTLLEPCYRRARLWLPNGIQTSVRIGSPYQISARQDRARLDQNGQPIPSKLGRKALRQSKGTQRLASK
jgi:hypothetical protein